MILSFNPILQADRHVILADREPGQKEISLIRKADAVLLPQERRKTLFEAATRHCRHVFPDYRCRYNFPGKIGDIQVFRQYNLPHPRSWIFETVNPQCFSFVQGMDFPLIIKSNYGGEGHLVFRVDSAEEARSVLQMLKRMEATGYRGVLLQEFIPAADRTLRVVVMGEDFYSYWRVQQDKEIFQHNLDQGAFIDKHSHPEQQKAGIELVQEFTRLTGVNLAGIDVLFGQGQKGGPSRPLLLEVNYYFGRRGLGGSDRYYELLQETVNKWLQSIGLQPIEESKNSDSA